MDTNPEGDKVKAFKNTESEFERRGEERLQDPCPVFFVANQRIYEGHLNNYSESGAHINKDNYFLKGQAVVVALPHDVNKNAGKIVWADSHGFGIKFKEE